MVNIILRKKATKTELLKISKHFNGYIKVVVDIENKIAACGADRHFDEEKILLSHGSKQNDLWGGGFDVETKEIDYNSIINLRPNQENPGRDILSSEIRKKFKNIVEKILQ